MDLRRVYGWSLLLGLTVLPALSVAAGKCERLVVTGSPDAPPYLWQDPQNPKHLIGASADLLQQVAGELGIKVELLYAGKRSQALDEVRSGRMDMLADASLTVSELDTLDYIHPPLLENDYLVWTRKDSTLVYNEAQDLHGHPGALSEKSRMTPAFGVFAEQQLTLARTPNLTQAFQKLLLGEVEFVLAGRYSGLTAAQTLNLANDLIARPQPIDKPGLFLAVSHNSACNDPWLRGQLAKKMTELPASGLTEAVLQRNIERWKAQLSQPQQPSVSTPKQ
ncbi:MULTISPECIES: ABC transporter substrate-binding protein [unclassified Pseudomonas]|uniref:substrate-binding periplasmic protein n=1 Tax=unclassified Pseudomonas TaxID=196821 RepID=UPI000C87B435|nr:MULTISPECIES: transporter substrate-binding domain-containing protein [unclassified Pseudomonas]PMU10807.1 ABC transporter substrate-binding protein [Pseudomonas sp. FW305-20]PMU20578.1 ABC transporter substrate-binding protein [Pseudomonas sp. FW305-122]PMU39978.1 ABC transporter substrate-binding protein [Pseudomonas sp. FW305-47B]PMX63394.1 ABC transporter substrate-binding protein [Pseudomonas sp. FW305-33]PMX69312.1 ABC transporter substrate-binding protein [Pseudomonas sp. FW305-60]